MSNVDNSASVRPLKPSEVFQAILAARRANVSLMNWGPPGVAKSEIAMAVADSLGIAFADIRLSQMDPSHLRGIPFKTSIGTMEGVRWSVPFVMPKDLDHRVTVTVDDEDGTIVWFLNPLGSNDIPYIREPIIEAQSLRKDAVAVVTETQHDNFFVTLYKMDAEGNPTDEAVTGKVRVRIRGKAEALLALEEINSAAPSVQAAAYQLVLDKRLGEYVVPKGVSIMAMGNRDQDKAVTFKMGSALANRFDHIETIVDFREWQMWAAGRGIHPTVLGYLSAYNQDLFTFKPGETSRAFATPRSWVMVSNILTNNPDLPEGVKTALIVGAIGNATGATFMTQAKFADQVPPADDILEGRVERMPKIKDDKGNEVDTRSNIGVCYQVVTTLCYRLADLQKEVITKHGSKDFRESKDYLLFLEKADRFFQFMMNGLPIEVSIMGARIAMNVHMLALRTRLMPNFATFSARYRELIVGG
jgi:MoxR-like ATPase